MAMNICLNYLYRDYGNFKNWGEVVFANKNNFEPKLLEQNVREKLIDGEFFVAEKAGLKKLNFPEHIKELDHDWHEFHSFEYTEENVNDENDRDIDDFIVVLQHTIDFNE